MAILVSLFLLATGVVGILNGLENLQTAASPGQRVVDFAALTYGVAGVLAGLALWRSRRAAVYLAIVWGIAASVTAGVCTSSLRRARGPPLGGALERSPGRTPRCRSGVRSGAPVSSHVLDSLSLLVPHGIASSTLARSLVELIPKAASR